MGIFEVCFAAAVTCYLEPVSAGIQISCTWLARGGWLAIFRPSIDTQSVGFPRRRGMYLNLFCVAYEWHASCVDFHSRTGSQLQ